MSRLMREVVLPDLGVSLARRKHRNCRPRSSQNPFQPKGAESTSASFLIKLLLRNYLLRAKPDNRQTLDRIGHLVDSWGWSQGTDWRDGRPARWGCIQRQCFNQTI